MAVKAGTAAELAERQVLGQAVHEAGDHYVMLGPVAELGGCRAG